MLAAVTRFHWMSPCRSRRGKSKSFLMNQRTVCETDFCLEERCEDEINTLLYFNAGDVL